MQQQEIIVQVDEIDLKSIGPKFECNPVFPAKTNTEFIEVQSHLLPILNPVLLHISLPLPPPCSIHASGGMLSWASYSQRKPVWCTQGSVQTWHVFKQSWQNVWSHSHVRSLVPSNGFQPISVGIINMPSTTVDGMKLLMNECCAGT